MKDSLITFSTANVSARLKLLSLLAHNLTVATRASYANEDFEVMFGLNEIQYAVTARMRDVIASVDDWNERDFSETLEDLAVEYGCKNEYHAALQHSSILLDEFESISEAGTQSEKIA